MAEMRKVFKAFENFGRAVSEMELSRQTALHGYARGVGSDTKSTAASRSLDPLHVAAMNIATKFDDPKMGHAVLKNLTAGVDESQEARPDKPRGKFLQITKVKEAFLLRLPAASPENLLGRQGYRHFGDWRVELIEDDRPLLLETFDEYHDAVAYVAHVLRTVNNEDSDSEDEYAAVGEVPC